MYPHGCADTAPVTSSTVNSNLRAIFQLSYRRRLYTVGLPDIQLALASIYVQDSLSRRSFKTKIPVIPYPGTSPLVLTVGSCDDNHKIPDFSSRGPTLDGTIKPDLIAPGVNVSSLVADDCKGYVEQTGTSMSAPYVAGLAASLYSKHPQACPSEIKNALIHSATPIKKADRNAQGHGLLLWKCIP
ncbi:MAG: S8 family serine peptidase [Anaerovoracaceae bacterium]